MWRTSVTVVAALAIAGCGGSSSEKAKIVDTVKDWQTATLEQDANRYCSYLTGEEKRRLVVKLAPLGGGFDCPGAMEKAYGLVGGDDLEKVRVARDTLRARRAREGHESDRHAGERKEAWVGEER